MVVCNMILIHVSLKRSLCFVKFIFRFLYEFSTWLSFLFLLVCRNALFVLIMAPFKFFVAIFSTLWFVFPHCLLRKTLIIAL